MTKLLLILSLLLVTATSFAKSDGKHNNHESYAKKGQLINWNGTRWVPSHYHGIEDLDDGEFVGDKMYWDHDGWKRRGRHHNDDNAYLTLNEFGDLVIDGQVHTAGIVFPDGSIQTSASQGGEGTVGPMGPQGPEGPMGPAGADGADGAMGPQGPEGPMGPQGLKGDKGDQGDVGPMGPAGPMGLNGLDGAMGPQGPQGIQGIQGEQGLKGDKGDKGDQGDVGPMGPMGPQGLQGIQGLAGADGAIGPMGPQGPQGLQGVQGLKGDKGDKGDQGPAGSDATVSLTAGAGMVPGVIGSTGTIAVNVGTAAGQIPQIGTDGKLPSSILPSSGGSTVKIAYLKDIKPQGTHGGTCTAGVWNRRVLNNLSGDSSIASISNNTFILQPGVYDISANAPAVVIANHKIRLFNVSAGSEEVMGSVGYSHNTYPTLSYSFLVGTVTVTAATTFAIEHSCKNTYATAGLGIASGLGGDEVYTQVRIMKIE